MIRSSAIISFAVSLLLWSGQVLGSEPQAANTQESEGTTESAVVVRPTPDCPHTACPDPCPTHGRHCPRLTHRHAAGQPCPLTHGLGQRLGRDGGRPSLAPVLAPQPIPMMPPPGGGFFGTLGMPRQYQYDQPYMYPQMSMPPAYPMQGQAGHIHAGHPMPTEQSAAYPMQGQPGHPMPAEQSASYPMQGQPGQPMLAGQSAAYPMLGQPGYPMPAGYPMQAGQSAAYPMQGQPGQGYPGYVVPPANERIVYIPYAMPPPITVERLAKALPIPRPLTLRRVLGDANMYEYPEMPLHLYTTRGPRDFLAPNPPGIGE